MKKKSKPPVRSAGNSRMTISLPESLLRKIDAKAASDGRTRSNWVVKSLEELVGNNGIHSLGHADENDYREAK
jgi:metal-responsive CopG/Arc/MetJ family transcriptional regulator